MKTAESVSPMHPDKICDRISDAVLDACLAQDKNTRAAIEVMGGHGIITVTGELSTEAYVDIRKIAQRVAGDQYGVQVNVVRQSPEIANGVDKGGAGDQGIMTGYATSATPEMLPLEVVLARKLNQELYKNFGTDGKTQITIDDEGKIVAVVASFQKARKTLLEEVTQDWLRHQEVSEDLRLHINPAGDWSIGGFEADTGLTGRKLAVDNYGPSIPLGGGCFSGKDASKVDRSAAYMARRIAVDILRKEKAAEVFVRLSYAIGYRDPIEATAVVWRNVGRPDGKLEPETYEVQGYDLTPAGIIKFLDLKKPQFEKTAEYGHFGHDFAWEK